MTITLWGYSISTLSVDDIVCRLLEKKQEFSRIVTLNPQMIVAGFHDSVKKRWLQDATYIIPDGHGITWALKRIKKSSIPVQTGVSLVTSLLNSGSFSFYCLGGSPFVSSQLKQKLTKRYPNVSFVGIEHGFQTEESLRHIYEDIIAKKPDIILIGMGYPKQEDIIFELSKRCCYGCAIGVGGVFDVLSEQKKLAPKWIRRIRMEWLYRGLQEPKRMLKWGYLMSYIGLVLRNKL